MKIFRLCLLIFVVCSIIPFNAAAIPYEAGSFATVGLSWGALTPEIPDSGTPVVTEPMDFSSFTPSLATIPEVTLSVIDTLEILPTDYATEVKVVSGEGSPVAAPVPEPSTLVLLGCGLLGLAWLRHQRKQM